VDTAYVHVAGRVAGPWFFLAMNLTLLVASVGSGMGAQLGAARLLYGMGRSNALPRSFFGAVDPVRWVPRNNVIFVGLVALLGAFLLSYSLATEMLNFGALLAFIGVNAAAFVRYFVRASAKRLANLVLPDFRSDDLLAALAKPEPGGNAGGRALDGCWHCVRRVENARVSHGFDQFRDPLRGGDLNENNDRLRVLLRRKLLGTNHESCRGHGFGVFSGKPVGLGSLRLTALVPPAQYRRDDKNEIHHAS